MSWLLAVCHASDLMDRRWGAGQGRDGFATLLLSAVCCCCGLLVGDSSSVGGGAGEFLPRLFSTSEVNVHPSLATADDANNERGDGQSD